MTWVLDGGEWSALRLGRFTPGEIAPGVHWIGLISWIRRDCQKFYVRAYVLLRYVNLKMILKTDSNLAQAARFWFLIAEIRFQSQVSSCAIHVGRSGTEAGLAPCFFCFSLLIVIPPLLPEVYDSRDHAAPYYILGLQVGCWWRQMKFVSNEAHSSSCRGPWGK
jgi:hypothetical protein